MRRRPWIVSGAVVAVIAVVVGSLAVVDAVAAAHAPGVPAACPATSPAAPGYSGLSASWLRLVPFTPEHALLCRYNGLNAGGGAAASGLVGQARVDGTRAGALAAAMNAAVSKGPSGPVACPEADGSRVDAYLWNSGRRIRVSFATNGCQTADNGARTHAWVARSDIVGRLRRLTP